MPECSSTPAEAKTSTSQTIQWPSWATAARVSALATKPEKSGKAEIEAAPIRQKTVVAGIDLNRPPSSEAFTVPTRSSTAPMLMNNSAL